MGLFFSFLRGDMPLLHRPRLSLSLSLPFLSSFPPTSREQLIRCGNVRLAHRLLEHGANVALTNDEGLDCIAMAEEGLETRMRIVPHRHPSGTTTNGAVDRIDVSEWTDLVDELKRRMALERTRAEARDLARSRANDE
jgi:hypothetical protein